MGVPAAGGGGVSTVTPFRYKCKVCLNIKVQWWNLTTLTQVKNEGTCT